MLRIDLLIYILLFVFFYFVSSFWNSNCDCVVERAPKLEDNFMLGARVQVGYVLGARERSDAICNYVSSK